jgi:hypothetical protein
VLVHQTGFFLAFSVRSNHTVALTLKFSQAPHNHHMPMCAQQAGIDATALKQKKIFILASVFARK